MIEIVAVETLLNKTVLSWFLWTKTCTVFA